MTIKLHNTATRKKEVFEPLDPTNVRMYVCGPTVYDRAHLGNARPVVVFDVLYRLLRHTYGAEHVTYVRNFTDVDDKINDTALARKNSGAKGTLEELIASRTEETIAWYHDDMDAVGALRPDQAPRATAYIPQMQAMIQELIDKGFAYSVPVALGHNSGARYVLMDSTAAPRHAFLSVDDLNERGVDYGSLSGRSVNEMIAGSRAEKGEGKRNPMDSVLWKPSTIEQPGWESPWGFGRPGWHIECSAMSRELLGKTFDIHGGGLDLMFPHHENEIAQCRACDGADASARYWLHNEMLQVEGKKMSKSLGNFFTVRDLLDQGVPGEVIRFVMLSTHYRKPMDWTEDKSRQALQRLTGWKGILKRGLTQEMTEEELSIHVDERVIDAVSNDLNTHAALTRLLTMETIAKTSKADSDAVKAFAASIEFLGFGKLGLLDHARRGSVEFGFDVADKLAKILEKLDAARAAKDYDVADKLRDGLQEAGWKVQIGQEGAKAERSEDFDPSKLEGLL